MRAFLNRIIACLVLSVATGAHAAPLLVDFQGSDSELVLGRNAQILEDPDHNKTLNDVQADAAPWVNFHASRFNFGFSASSWWVRVRLHNTEARGVQRIFDVGSALEDEVDVYIVRANHAPIEHIATGDRRPFDTRPVETRVPSLPLSFAPGEQVDVYMRLATHDGLHEAMAPKLWHPRAHAHRVQTENFLYGLYYGALIAVLACNLFLFLSTRERAFAWYVAYVSAFMLWNLTFRGYALQYLWPQAPVFNNQVLPIAASASYCTFAIFMMVYLDLRRQVPPWMYRMMLAATLGNVLCTVPAMFNRYALTFALNIPLGVALIVTAIFINVHLLRRGSRPARFIIVSFTPLALGVVLYYLCLLGALPSNLITENFLQLGSAAQVVLLAFGAADQMNQLKTGKLRAERQARAAQTALNIELESLVQRRTRALELANQRLADMAITDELTGAFNERHYTAVLEAEVSRHARNGAPLALCLFDLDHFKCFNDCHGQAAGDEALQRIIHLVAAHLRRAADQLFRVSGEKFALLFALDAEDADDCSILDHVERIRCDIEALDMVYASPRPGDPSTTHPISGTLTASFGLMVLATGAPPASAQELHDAASQLLAQAKRHGRNQVRVQAWVGQAGLVALG